MEGQIKWDQRENDFAFLTALICIKMEGFFFKFIYFFLNKRNKKGWLV